MVADMLRLLLNLGWLATDDRVEGCSWEMTPAIRSLLGHYSGAKNLLNRKPLIPQFIGTADGGKNRYLSCHPTFRR
jgi:hypothetical protein